MKRILYYVVVSLQLLFLIGMSVSYFLIDEFGETITLETLPVDPQDIFYGDYVTLRYSIEEIPEQKWNGADSESVSGVVYVVVEKGNDGFYQVVQASDHKLEVGSNQVLLKANYNYYNQFDDTHRVNYGLNRYYIEDDTGANYERSGEMAVTVKVAPWGQKKIVDLE